MDNDLQKMFIEDAPQDVDNLTGVNKRFWANDETTLSLCLDAAESLIKNYSRSINDKTFKFLFILS